jgi:hypothetical protein
MIFSFKHQEKAVVTDMHKIRIPPSPLNGHNSSTNLVAALKFEFFFLIYINVLVDKISGKFKMVTWGVVQKFVDLSQNDPIVDYC